MAFDPADVTSVDGLGPLSTATIAALLTTARDALVTEMTALGDDWARWRPRPGEWSANECLGHIIEADLRGFAGRIERILAEDGVGEQGWDQVQVAADRRDNERALADILAEFRTGRDAGIMLVARL